MREREHSQGILDDNVDKGRGYGLVAFTSKEGGGQRGRDGGEQRKNGMTSPLDPEQKLAFSEKTAKETVSLWRGTSRFTQEKKGKERMRIRVEETEEFAYSGP